MYALPSSFLTPSQLPTSNYFVSLTLLPSFSLQSDVHYPHRNRLWRCNGMARPAICQGIFPFPLLILFSFASSFCSPINYLSLIIISVDVATVDTTLLSIVGLWKFDTLSSDNSYDSPTTFSLFLCFFCFVFVF